ncbi:ABC transporter ATP-binding protein [Albidovulum sp.]|uniref:ABC transporter ATP-binding protein n=1 Tax=Albidovulum sp. TaxID=1872424 RepID=UPI0039B9AFC4
MTPQPYISIRDVEKLYGPYRAVEKVSFDIPKGEFFSLLGPSGCGKTTLLRMIAGFEGLSGGEIFLDGQPTSGIPPHLRPVNMVFQNYAIFPHLNVRNNIAYGLRKLRLPKARRHEMVDEMLDLIKLPGYGDRRSGQLSGGQRQRIALARALILRPKVLLLDEPLGALDKQLREEMQVELRELQRSIGITFIFVTHDQDEALAMSDRIAVMHGGRVLQIDTPNQLYERPRSRKVASFIGTMNFFRGTIRSVKGSHALEVEGLGTVTSVSTANTFSAGEEVLLAIRPERFRLVANLDVTQRPRVVAKLQDLTYLGERSLLRLSTGEGGSLISVSVQSRNLPHDLAKGQQLGLDWDDEHAIFLDPDQE